MGEELAGRSCDRAVTYLIFYRVDKPAKQLEILRFWYGARDPP